jgi:L-alanine-DL-glutamate epimerase-like enolase superfamily enzyme
MQINFQTFTVNKRFPLTISRGTTAQTTNIWLQITAEGIIGWGEASPFGVGNHRQSTEKIQETLQQIVPILQSFSPWQRQEIEALLEQMQIPSAVKAAVDMALHDWLGKRVNLPLWQLWGLDKNAIVPTSVTIGINSPAGARARTRDWLQFMDVQLLKVKLGSTEGIEADKKMLLAKAHDLQVMFGCYSDSCLANTAALQLAPLADYLDLDSHLNLIDDPFIGAVVENGRVLPNNLPGLGVKHSASVA